MSVVVFFFLLRKKGVRAFPFFKKYSCVFEIEDGDKKEQQEEEKNCCFSEKKMTHEKYTDIHYIHTHIKKTSYRFNGL